jgi:hypothetical protein
LKGCDPKRASHSALQSRYLAEVPTPPLQKIWMHSNRTDYFIVHNQADIDKPEEIEPKFSQPVSILNKSTSFTNRDLNMDHFPIRGENLFQHIISDIGVKATNKNLCSTTAIDF